ncbi:MAG: ArnT family glycosyltransferase [Aggregatilineales bacterium]
MENMLNTDNSTGRKFSPQNITMQLWSKRFLLIAFVVLIIGGSVVRLQGYDRFLPHITYTDEVVYVALGEHFRGISDQTPLIETYGTLAPAYVLFTMGFQELHDTFKTVSWDMPAQDYQGLRLTSTIMGILTIAAIVWAASMIAGGWAGILAGAVWAFSPLVIDINSYAIPDPALYLVSALALGTAIAAWKYESPRYLFVSLIMGIIAIYLKLWVAHTLIPCLVVGVLLFFKNPR